MRRLKHEARKTIMMIQLATRPFWNLLILTPSSNRAFGLDSIPPDPNPVLVFAEREHPLTLGLETTKYEYMKTHQAPHRTSLAVKIGVSRQVAIPKRIHDQLGLEPGDNLEARLDGDRVVMTPKALIEKRVAEGLDDIRKGRVRGPFRSMPALVRSLRKSRPAKSKWKSRKS
jgi:AbrB family looped-hinge helix DNA binding protein